jgi:hypothetical protein
MANPALSALTTQVTSTVGVIKSATVLINGIQAKIDAGIAAALANGATAEELAPLQLVADELAAETSALSAAVAANP